MLRTILSRLGGGTTRRVRRPTTGGGGRGRARGGASGNADIERGVRSIRRGVSRRRGMR